MVKTYYKIKIGFRDFSCFFVWFSIAFDPIIYKKSLSCLPIGAVLEGKRGCIGRQERLYWKAREAVLGWKRGSIATL